MEFYDIVTDMSEQFREQVEGIVRNALSVAGKQASDYAEEIKNKLDEQFGPTWHVIVGRSFGSDVTHEAYNYLNCGFGPWSLVIFKAGYL